MIMHLEEARSSGAVRFLAKVVSTPHMPGSEVANLVENGQRLVGRIKATKGRGHISRMFRRKMRNVWDLLLA